MGNLLKIKEILENNKKIVITSHLNPDGDAVGSSLAIASWLRLKGHDVTIILPNDAPSSIAFAYGYSEIAIFMHCEKFCRAKLREADIIFAMDYNDISTRIGVMGDFILNHTTATRILIDHHLDPPLDMYNISLSDQTASSTSFLVFRLIEQMGDLDKISVETAQNIYLGMMTDTGNFSYGLLSSELFRAVASLVDIGLEPVKMNIQISNHQSEQRMRLIGYSIYKKMVVLPHLKSAYLWLTADELEQFAYNEGDAEGLVNMPLSISNIVNSAIFIEKKDLIKISLRSQDSEGLDMNKFARKYFIGGGHRNAAGGKSYNKMEEVISIFVKGLEVEMREIEKS